MEKGNNNSATVYVPVTSWRYIILHLCVLLCSLELARLITKQETG